MTITQQQLQAAQECLQTSLKLIGENRVEDVIRHNFTSYLRSIFTTIPSWVIRHIEGGEAAVKFRKAGKLRTGFVDNLVDLTAIEYEGNLTNAAKFATGYGQVKDYCASLLNQGNDPELIIGVLSDTVRWKAYKIQPVAGVEGNLGRDDIELEEIESFDLSAADEVSAKTLINFLTRHLARLGSRPLNAFSIAKDLGFESKFCEQNIYQFRDVVNTAFVARPDYGELIATLWQRFINFIRENNAANDFSQGTYADEFYIITLAKLVCANVIEQKALLSSPAELETILQGEFFRARGITNLVEYDYFGWLNEQPLLSEILPVAHSLQDDLQAYDFSRIPSEDIFGNLLAQLARRAQRLLLGQEWTPSWLSRLLVNNVLAKLPEGETPQLIDMCCGSGAIVVEAVRFAKDRINALGDLSQEQKLTYLTKAITGFDIDPLAVILSKINWILSARDWLEPFGAVSINIPVYHADSLFAITPLSEAIEDEEGQEFYRLRIANTEIQLPGFLISPSFQGAFDSILDVSYNIATSAPEPIFSIDENSLREVTTQTLQKSAIEADEQQQVLTSNFIQDLVVTVDKLSREGRNGIWAFILRNSYRPGLVVGQFNGLVSNPPWLTLSKIANNPYQDVLRRKAEQLNITPPGPSFLHIEMATIFLLHAIDRYLKNDAVIGCITPDSVLNGFHHHPFRSASFSEADNPVNFEISEIWRIQEGTFKNKAIVLFGKKQIDAIEQINPIPGANAGEEGLTELTFYRNQQGQRTAWSEQDLGDNAGFFTPANFRQGVDVMPRTLFFHELEALPPVGGVRQWRVNPINIGESPFTFLISGAKKCEDFRINPRVLPDDLFFDVFISNLLTPFDIARPAKALLPIRKNQQNTWEPLNAIAIAAKGGSAIAAFQQMSNALPEGETIWGLIDMRNKLTQQIINPGGYLVFTGTSGEKVCSTYVSIDNFDLSKLIIDQTLNWARVETEDEAIYLAGLFNSPAINSVIGDFQPEGAFGKRHIHSLPFGVTPQFDNLQEVHQNVVQRTRELIAEYNEAKLHDPEIQRALNPTWSTLARRRSIITAKLREFPSYEAYNTACRVLYGV